MAAGTILVTDIVGFSKKPTSEQRRLVDELTSEVLFEVRILLAPPMRPPELIAMPTGDGIVLAFLHQDSPQWDIYAILRLINRLQRWACQETESRIVAGESVSLRIGVHVGPVEIVTDINGRPNVCGDSINYAQRVMDSANAGQILFSEYAFREYVGNQTSRLQYQGTEYELVGPIDVTAKHGLRIPVFKLVPGTPHPGWNTEDPQARDLMAVRLVNLPRDYRGEFTDRLVKSSKIAVVQFAGERLLEYLNGGVELSRDLERLWIFMPDSSIFVNMKLHVRHTADFFKENLEGWISYLEDVSKKNSNVEIKLRLFKLPPYFAGVYLNWDRPSGSVSVSPYIWNRHGDVSPAFEIDWAGKTPSKIYEAYVRGLEFLDSNSESVLIRPAPESIVVDVKGRQH